MRRTHESNNNHVSNIVRSLQTMHLTESSENFKSFCSWSNFLLLSQSFPLQKWSEMFPPKIATNQNLMPIPWLSYGLVDKQCKRIFNELDTKLWNSHFLLMSRDIYNTRCSCYESNASWWKFQWQNKKEKKNYQQPKTECEKAYAMNFLILLKLPKLSRFDCLKEKKKTKRFVIGWRRTKRRTIVTILHSRPLRACVRENSIESSMSEVINNRTNIEDEKYESKNSETRRYRRTGPWICW